MRGRIEKIPGCLIEMDSVGAEAAPTLFLFVPTFFYKKLLSKFRFLLACLFLSPSLYAQYQDLLRNPDIVWIAEYTTDFVMNPENEADDFEKPNYLDIIQFRNSGAEGGLYGRKIHAQKYLSQQLYHVLGKPGLVCYKDSLLNDAMTERDLYNAMTKIDTGIGGCYNDTFIIRNEVSYDEIGAFRVRQIFWYDQKSGAFDARLLAFAPVVDTKDNEGNLNGQRALFWLKADEPNPPKRIRPDRFNYIFQTKMLANAPRFEDFKVWKGSLDFKKHFEQEIRHPAPSCLEASEYKPLDAAIIDFDCFGTDTIVTFHPETYEETITIENRNCIEQIERIRFVQNWYFDERRGQLYARLVGVAPLATIRDAEGNFRYLKPLYYHVYR